MEGMGKKKICLGAYGLLDHPAENGGELEVGEWRAVCVKEQDGMHMSSSG